MAATNEQSITYAGLSRPRSENRESANLSLSVSFALSSCAPVQQMQKYVHIFEIQPSDPQAKVQDGQIYFENDTIKINYFFWAEDGVMGFSIFNKLSKPIYKFINEYKSYHLSRPGRGRVH
jgi:hypothetical protein